MHVLMKSYLNLNNKTQGKKLHLEKEAESFTTEVKVLAKWHEMDLALKMTPGTLETSKLFLVFLVH